MKDLWTKFLCGFIGWDYKLLKECSVASKTTLHRYVGAVILLMLIWAYIGYGMATRYFKVEQEWIKVVIAIVFSFVIWLIERQIISIVGKNKTMYWFRVGLAAIMACIGATIIDQAIFGADIDANMESVKNEKTKEKFTNSKQLIEDEMVQNQRELDILEIKSGELMSDIYNNPTISIRSVKVAGIDSLSKPIYATEQIHIPNPKQQDLDRMNARINVLRANLDNNYKKLQNLRDSIREEVDGKVGILDELKVTFSEEVVLSHWTSLTLYLLIFSFFVLVELFVVTGKGFSRKCDYEVMVERQQEMKIKEITSLLPISEREQVDR